MFTSRIFWTTFIVFSIVIFIITANMNRAYQARVKILFLPKNETIAENLDPIGLNAGEIGNSLSFYSMLIQLHEEVEDAATGLPDYKRQNYWNSIASFERIENSDVLRITVRHQDQEQAELFAHYAAKDLTVVMSKYYDIKNELEIRIIDGPIIDSGSVLYRWDSAVLSVLLGFVLGAIAYLVSSLLSSREVGSKRVSFVSSPDAAKRRREEMLREMRDKIKNPKITSREKIFIPSEEELEKERTRASTVKTIEQARQSIPAAGEIKKDLNLERKPAPVIQKKPVTFEKKSAAPDNLPVAGEFAPGAIEKPLPREKETGDSEKSAEIQEKLKEMRDHEATSEEVKKRLNKLLRGEM